MTDEKEKPAEKTEKPIMKTNRILRTYKVGSLPVEFNKKKYEAGAVLNEDQIPSAHKKQLMRLGLITPEG